MGRSGAQADVACAIQSVAGSLLRVAEDDVVEVFGIDVRRVRWHLCRQWRPVPAR